jgi:hypothetical protein
VLVLEGHVKQILGLDFNPAGYQVATGSADHTVRIWDLRRKNCMYIIPAHSNLISELKYQVRGASASAVTACRPAPPAAASDAVTEQPLPARPSRACSCGLLTADTHCPALPCLPVACGDQHASQAAAIT